MRKCVSILSLHPVYKDQGDDKYFELGRSWWLKETSHARTNDEAAWVLLTALFFLMVRSQKALRYLVEHPNFLLSSMSQFAVIWDAIVLPGSNAYGLDDSR
jgi:hypothetical protein